jgi:hypothetical protein
MGRDFRGRFAGAVLLARLAAMAHILCILVDG